MLTSSPRCDRLAAAVRCLCPAVSQIGALSGNTLPVGIVVLGVFILLLSLLGGVSAYKESRAFLLVYFLFLLLLTLILFFVGIAVYVERNNAATYITQGWQTATPALRSSLQSIFQCCGCCTSQYVQSNDTAFPCSLPANAQQGCLPVFVSYFQSYYVTAGGCGIAFAVIMFVGMLIVCFLMQGIKQKRAEQDLAKLRANNNTDDADIQLAMGAAAAQTGGGGGDRRRRQQQAAGGADDDEDEEEEDEEELEEEDETDEGR